MKIKVIFLAFILCFAFADISFAGEEHYARTDGYIISEDKFYVDKCLHLLDKGKTVFTLDATVQNDKGNVIFVKANSVVLSDESLKLLSGGIGVVTGENEAEFYTGTEKAVIAPHSKVAIRVDDYGNAFNYCVEGSIVLTDIFTDNTVTLSGGEYIAVTVKKGIRILKKTSLEDVEKLGIKFADNFDGEVSDEYFDIELLNTDFSEDCVITSVRMNKVYKLIPTKENFSEDLYLECDASKASVVLYDADFNVVADSNKTRGALKPKISVTGKKEDIFYIVFTSADDTSFDLCHHVSMNLFDRMFELLKKIAIPAVVAIVLVCIYYFIKKGTSKKA